MHPVKATVIEAVADTVSEQLIAPVLIGPAGRIQAAAREGGIDISPWEVVDTEHSHEAAAKAVSLAAAGELDALMKGSLHSGKLLGAVVRADSGLWAERRISHAFVMHIESYPKPFIITDAAVNIAPDLMTKADIVQNAVNLWHVAHLVSYSSQIVAAHQVK